MREVSQEFLDAVLRPYRKWDNGLVIFSRKGAEIYNECEIQVSEIMSDTNELSMGKAFAKELRAKIYHPKRTIEYVNSLVKVAVGLIVDEETEDIEEVAIGNFYIYEATTSDEWETLDIVAYDRMYKLSQVKHTPLDSDYTDTTFLDELANEYLIDTPNITTLGVPITPVDGTVAEQLGWLAGLQGKNAVFKGRLSNSDELEFRWYEPVPGYNNRWADFPITWAEMTDTWGDWVEEGLSTIGRSQQKENGLTISYKPFTIQSVTSGTSENVLTVGSGKGITFENPYMNQTLLNQIANRVIGETFVSGSVNTFGNPAYEVGDIVSVQDKDLNAYTMFISNIEWNFSGGCSSTIYSVDSENATTELTPVQVQTRGLAKNSFPVAENVPQSAEKDFPTVKEFNALLTSLKNAGIMRDDEILEK